MTSLPEKNANAATTRARTTLPSQTAIKNQLISESAVSTPTNKETIEQLKETLEKAAIYLRMETVALDESRQQIRLLFPIHFETGRRSNSSTTSSHSVSRTYLIASILPESR
eukprot:GHVP01028834.1.p1 GENE.GHVP01028834.1~~GHVP01028834.1.p1  ORF type:complete len:112 (-),score=6.70 GHVP01028834.1:59-394(-)